MERPLRDVRVLWVGDPGADRDQLSVWLGSEGAQVRLADWAQVEGEPARSAPNVLLVDHRGHAQQASELLARTRELPSIALIDKDDSSQADAHVALPAHPSEVVAAIARLIAQRKPQPILQNHEETLQSLLRSRAASSDLRGVLQLLNASGPFRFTGVLRFEPNETLTSLWTFDRENPEQNAFPDGTPTSASYCSRVRDSMVPFAMPDAAQDPSVINHPARNNVLAYCGVPLLRDDGTFFGTLCQFDTAPRFFAETTVKRLQDAAAILRNHWPGLRR